MSDQPTVTQPPPAVQVDWRALLSVLYALLPTGLIKTALGFLLGGYIAGTVVSHHIDSTIKGATPKGIIEKFLPPKHKPADAIGKIQFGNSGCTATIIGPVKDGDATVDILTAAHCVNVGSKGRMWLKDGRVLNVTCVSRDAAADVAWLRAERPGGSVPSLLLCDVPPPPGTPVWHMGYGIDKPGNKEDGTVIGVADAGRKVSYHLSVSPGDSGGGIVCTADNRVISPVCCTTRLSAPGTVFGGTPAAAAKIRPTHDAVSFEPELIYPMQQLPEEAAASDQG